MLTLVCCGDEIGVLSLLYKQIKRYIMLGDLRSQFESTHLANGGKMEFREWLKSECNFYEIHVSGKNGFSTVVISVTELDDDDIINKAYEYGSLEGGDCHYVDYIEPLSFEEWDIHFNFNNI